MLYMNKDLVNKGVRYRLRYHMHALLTVHRYLDAERSPRLRGILVLQDTLPLESFPLNCLHHLHNHKVKLVDRR